MLTRLFLDSRSSRTSVRPNPLQRHHDRLGSSRTLEGYLRYLARRLGVGRSQHCCQQRVGQHRSSLILFSRVDFPLFSFHRDDSHPRTSRADFPHFPTSFLERHHRSSTPSASTPTRSKRSTSSAGFATESSLSTWRTGIRTFAVSSDAEIPNELWTSPSTR